MNSNKQIARIRRVLKPGQLPKPNRIQAVIRRINDLYQDMVRAENVKDQLAGRDWRTLGSYNRSIQDVEQAIVELHFILNLLRESVPARKYKRRGG